MVVALAATTAHSTGPAVAAPGDPLLPDLVTRPFSDVYFQGGGEQRQLRLANTIGNKGVGPLEVFSVPENTGACPQADDRPAFQRIFEDSADPGSPGYFKRSQDPDSGTRFAGCVRYHDDHFHWHFEDFSQYLLRSEATGHKVAESTKVSFCIIDTDHPFPDLPGSPSNSYYGSSFGGGWCSDPEAITGLSVGWADTYGASLSGQSLKIGRRLPDGVYCLISKADPSNRLSELDNGNNRFDRRYFLDAGARIADPRPGDCKI